MAVSAVLGPKLPDLQYLKRLARDQLVHLLESLPGRKDLVIDPDLMTPLDRIAGASLLKQHGVDKIFKLERTKIHGGCDQLVYLVRSKLTTTKLIADQITADIRDARKRKYKIIMTPRRLQVCDMVLEHEGVFGLVSIEELHLDLIPLDRDLLSMELPQFFRDYFLHGDQTWLASIAKSLVNIQSLFGPIPNVYGQGRCAKMVADMVEMMMSEQGERQSPVGCEIGHLFLIDRDVDYVTPLCTQVTYEGLLDDIFGIKSGSVEFGPDVTGTDKSIKIMLSGEDEVFRAIRDRHFSNVFGFLSAKAKELQTSYDKRHNLKSVQDMKQFVSEELSNLKKQHKALTLHIGACETITKNKSRGDFEEQMRTEHGLLEGVDVRECINFIEESINRQHSRTEVLRLLCMLSSTQGGLPSKDYKSLKTQFLQSYGTEHLLTLHNLKKLGLFVEQQAPDATANKLTDKMAAKLTDGMASLQLQLQLPKKSQFRAVSRKLNLIPKSAENFELRNPNDMAYVFSGAYAPLSCKLIEQVLQREGWTGVEDIAKLLPGDNFVHLKAKSARGKSAGSNPDSDKIVLVYFLGGCSYTEVSALRFLGKQKGYRFLVATTALINGGKLIESVSGWK
ncbi:VPS33B [Branchiostoma lanceolatum]|uniref:VPS33B protein n=1 Tax=Branchiostoma lanceolatum TaxID=7740 RepID=A0A8K0EKD0_BRALA|nr:VPS33B [Branchiostoma lanceolatum]